MNNVYKMLAYDIDHQKEDPYLYPGNMPMEALEKIPQTVVMTSEFCFVRRDALDFIERLKEANRYLDSYDHPGTMHGYELFQGSEERK